jgi:hypothetical protein
MPAFTQQQAQAYYNTLGPEDRAAVDASGGPSIAWFTNAVNAGVPDAVKAAGGSAPAESGWEEEGGYTLPWQDAADPSEWLGIRNPTPAELRKYANTTGWSEDFNRYSDRQLAAWINESWDPSINKFAGGVEKPTEKGGTSAPSAGQGGGGGGGGYGGGGGGGGFPSDVPVFEFDPFEAPSYEQAMQDPGFQFALKEGQDALERSAAAKGTLRSGGTLKDILQWGQGAAAQQYGDVYNRALQDWTANQGGRQFEWQSKYAPWELGKSQDLQRWTTKYGGDLQKYLQQEQNIYGLLSQPPPMYG